MNSFLNLFFCNKFCSRFFILACFLLCTSFSSFAIGGKGASPDTITKKVETQQKQSLIQRMSKEQLATLIDFIFEMDSLPQDMVNEILTSAVRYEQSALEPNSTVSASAAPVVSSESCTGYPGSDYYDDWDHKNVFTVKQLCAKEDTSYLLLLLDNEHSKFVLPFNGVVTSNFGWRDSANHNGMDIDLNRGDPVVASFDGKVRMAKYQGGFGNCVVIRHNNGLETVYAHLSRLKVKPDQDVKAGDLIGLGGATGHARGTHLHFEVRFKGIAVNPKYIISFNNQCLHNDRLMFKRTRYGWAAFPPDACEYVAVKGDTLLSVARRFGLSLTMLSKLNGISQWSRLKPGQVVALGN